MFTRKDAIEAIAAKFPVETIRQRDYANGGFKDVTWTPEKRLDLHYINLCEPELDALKEGGEGLPDSKADSFRASVEHNYKNKHGLW
ncbi:Hypothetical Protein OBI_RACECAR_61 [Arthrobacter phage Racecar]|nr:hypothetical protein PBI_RACECAR_143 [Arthrobacter phage Racecar]